MATKNITDFQVVKAQSDWHKNQDGKWGYELLQERHGECQKVCLRALDRAYQRGYLEYGVSLRTAWLTEKGKNLIDTAQGVNE
jgi:hypothetical protein